MNSSFQQKVAGLDARLREAAKPINVLKYLNWPDAIEYQFLADWQAGNPRLPDVSLKVPDWSQEIEELDQLVVDCEGEHPVLRYLAQTAWSYAEAGRMLMAAGSPEFSQSSIRLYGRPDDLYQTQSFTGVDAALFLLEKTAHLLAGSYVPINEDTSLRYHSPIDCEKPFRAISLTMRWKS